MAPVPLEPEVRYTPLLVVASHSAAVLYLAITLTRSLYTLYGALRPTEGTRGRFSRRITLAPLFAGLALLSLALAGYSSARYGTVSYKVWADQRGIEIPTSLFNGSNPSNARLQIARWLTDTPVYHDSLEIVVEKARRFWWGEQIDLATVSWSLLLAIEGRRRNIPTLWAYMLLAHLVSLSFAQNLFYLALLLTPSPLPTKSSSLPASLAKAVRRVFPPKPANWCPHPGLFLTLLLANYGAAFLLPYAAGTESFVSVVLLVRLLNFTPIVMPAVVPETWGTVHAHPHSAYGAFTGLFRFVSAASFALYAKATVTGLLYNLPDSHYHRHSIRIPFDTAERSSWERTTSAVGKLLGSTEDHPVVAGVGRDVLLSAVSLGVWAAVRAMDSRDVLLSALPFSNGVAGKLPLGNGSASSAGRQKQLTAAGEDNEGTGTSAAGKASTARRRKKNASVSSLDGFMDDGAATASKKRGRPRKTARAGGDEDPHDETYRPSLEERAEAVEGDEVLALGADWEAAAVAWGLVAVGGLAVGSAGVFGAECISR